MIMCVLLCYPVSIRIYYQQGGLFVVDIYFFCYLARNEKIAITHLWHAIEPQTMYHLIAKDKVAEQHILGKYSNCNSFGVTIALLTSQNFKVAITQLSKVQQV